MYTWCVYTCCVCIRVVCVCGVWWHVCKTPLKRVKLLQVNRHGATIIIIIVSQATPSLALPFIGIVCALPSFLGFHRL